MTKKYFLAVADIVRVPVKVKLIDGDGKEKEFKFHLFCDRLGAEEAIELFKVSTPYDVMKNHTKGWEGQRLILDEERKPVEFCDDALAALLDIQGLLLICFNAYVKASNAVEKI